jgi:hypothetical protein
MPDIKKMIFLSVPHTLHQCIYDGKAAGSWQNANQEEKQTILQENGGYVIK